MRYCHFMMGLICGFLQCFVLGGEFEHTHYCFKARLESRCDRSRKILEAPGNLGGQVG